MFWHIELTNILIKEHHYYKGRYRTGHNGL